MPADYNAPKQGNHRQSALDEQESHESGAGQAQEDTIMQEGNEKLKNAESGSWQEWKEEDQEEFSEEEGGHEQGERNALGTGETPNQLNVQQLLDKLVLVAKERKERGNDYEGEKSY